MKFDKNEHAISLHGLGFIEVELQPSLRIRVWHPTLPRRRNAEASVHTNRFNSKSYVIRGKLFHTTFKAIRDDHGTFVRFVHDGHRDRYGNRDWTRDGHRYSVQQGIAQMFEVGDSYFFGSHQYHKTEPGGATNIAVAFIHRYPVARRPASTLHQADLPHDPKFDRFQMTDEEMWDIVNRAIFDYSC